MKKKTSNLLRKAHLIINGATGTDVSKTTRDHAKREARKLYRKIKDLDPSVYNILKAEIGES
tara:strand:+ start:430 stop:615 length:186 start_codon:yes stop_codon:yes gene_type:complete